MCERKNLTCQKLTPNVNIEQTQKESRCITPAKLRFQGAKNNTPLIDAEETVHQTKEQFNFDKHWESQVNPTLMECWCMKNERPCSLKHICMDNKTKNNLSQKCVGCQKRVQRNGEQKFKNVLGELLHGVIFLSPMLRQ